MSITTTTEDEIHTIKLCGQFDFRLQNEFKAAYEVADKTMHFLIDFSVTEYMDSSALGMLLLLREYAGNESEKITLANCGHKIIEILDVAKFDQLFTIA